MRRRFLTSSDQNFHNQTNNSGKKRPLVALNTGFLKFGFAFFPGQGGKN